MSAARMTRPMHAQSDQLASNVTAILLSGPVVYTLLGWFGDRWLGTKPWLTLTGLLLGMGLSMYLVWIRYGNPGEKTGDPDGSVTTETPEGDA